MARAWQRAHMALKCGYENDCLVQLGEAYLVLSGPGWQKFRCARHAGRPVPDVIEEPRQGSFKTPSGFASAKQLAKVIPMGPKLIHRDPKMRQANDDA